MNFSKQTSFPQKIWKVLQVYGLLWRAGSKSKRPVKTSGHAVLHVVSQVDRVGGLEFQALELSRALADMGNFIAVLTDFSNVTQRQEFRNGFLIHRLGFQLQPGKLMLLFATVLFFYRKRRKYKILHVHGVTGFTLLAVRLGKWTGWPVVLKGSTKQDFTNIFSRADWKHRIYQRWLQRVDCFIAISDELKNEMIDCGIPASKIVNIPNIVNSNRFRPATIDARTQLRARFSAAKGEVVFLFLGRLVKRKGADVLLNAWKMVDSGSLWIIGDGPEKPALEKLAKDLELKNVVFGTTGSPVDYYQAADVFVLPSLSEGMPSVTLEAMSCALPVIATSIGGVVDQIQDGKQGLLIPANDPEALAKAMQKMISDPDSRSRWSQHALETARDQYDAMTVAAKYQQLYLRFGT